MISRLLRKLREDQKGGSIVELALVAPILSAVTIGIVDLSRAYTLKLVCEQAAQRAVEKVQSQRSVATSSYNTALTTEATNAMTAAGYSTGNTYTPDSWAECSSNGTSWTRSASFTTDCTTTYTARYASMRIQRSYTPMFTSRVWPGADASGNITVTGFAEVRMQ